MYVSNCAMDWLITEQCNTYAMAGRQLILLKHVNQTPVMAGCSSCELKFFIPRELTKDPDAARTYGIQTGIIAPSWSPSPKFQPTLCDVSNEFRQSRLSG
jgi:hypothetical protein